MAISLGILTQHFQTAAVLAPGEMRATFWESTLVPADRLCQYSRLLNDFTLERLRDPAHAVLVAWNLWHGTWVVCWKPSSFVFENVWVSDSPSASTNYSSSVPRCPKFTPCRPCLDVDQHRRAQIWEVGAGEGAPDCTVQQDGFSLQVVCKDLIKQLGHRLPWCDAYGTIRLDLQNAVRSQQANTPIGIKGPTRGRPCSSPISIYEAPHIPRTWLETTGSFLIPGWNFGFHRCQFFSKHHFHIAAFKAKCWPRFWLQRHKGGASFLKFTSSLLLGWDHTNGSINAHKVSIRRLRVRHSTTWSAWWSGDSAWACDAKPGSFWCADHAEVSPVCRSWTQCNWIRCDTWRENQSTCAIGHELHSDTHFHGRHQMQCLVGWHLTLHGEGFGGILSGGDGSSCPINGEIVGCKAATRIHRIPLSSARQRFQWYRGSNCKAGVWVSERRGTLLAAIALTASLVAA